MTEEVMCVNVTPSSGPVLHSFVLEARKKITERLRDLLKVTANQDEALF